MKKIIKLLTIVCAVSLLFAVGGCKKDEPAPSQSPAPTPVLSEEELYKDPVHITIELADGGLIKAELYPNLAPETVKNFTRLVDEKFYNGLIFHRVINGFMIQGGGFDADMKQKTAPTIKGEFKANGFENPLKHTRGVLSMARTDEPDSASSQFFIMHQDAPHLDGQYAAFGKVTEGMELVDAIAETTVENIPPYFENIPTTPQIIKSIKLEN